MPSRRLEDCVQELQAKIPLLMKDYATLYEDIDLIIKPICTLRSIAEQQILYAQGRTAPGKIVTKVDGITNIGMHNPTPEEPLSRAIDFGVFQHGLYITSDIYYYYIGRLANDYNLVWGGFWKSFRDRPHVEVKRS